MLAGEQTCTRAGPAHVQEGGVLAGEQTRTRAGPEHVQEGGVLAGEQTCTRAGPEHVQEGGKWAAQAEVVLSPVGAHQESNAPLTLQSELPELLELCLII